MTQAEFREIQQRRVARIAVSPSAARNQGASGVVEAAQEFLGAVNLQRFSQSGEAGFPDALEEATEELRQGLPAKARSWGLPRKLLNIFLRDILYNSFLCGPSGLEAVVGSLEVPLDSVTADRIKANLPPRTLPTWPGVKNLKPGLSQRFQTAARVIATARGVEPVHLDAIWWGAREL